MTPYEIISIVIAALAFVLSIYSAINTYYEKHIKTKIYLRWSYELGHQLNICLLVSNMSSRPSTITNIYFINEDETAESTWYPVKLVSQSRSNNNEAFAFSDCTPLNIPPRSSRTFVISFQNLRSANIITEKMKFKFKIDNIQNVVELYPKVVLNPQQITFALENRLYN